MAELLLSSSVLIAAMALLRLLLKNRVSARLIYALWLVAALRLMLPIQLAPSPVSVMNVPEQLYAQVSSEAFRPAETGPALTEPDPVTEPPEAQNLGMTAGRGTAYPAQIHLRLVGGMFRHQQNLLALIPQSGNRLQDAV